MWPKLIYFFGVAGAGKSFAAELLAHRFGYYHYDADCDFTARMREASRAGQTFTDDMRDEYYAIIARRINELNCEHEKLAVSQATYKERHRKFLLKSCPEMALIEVTADDALIEERLAERGDEVTPEYSRRVRLFYEAPANGLKLNNVAGPEEIVKRLEELFSSP